MSYEFLGKHLSGRFTIPSGIVTTAPSIIQRFLHDMPAVGVITTKSIGLEARAGYREPVYSQFAPGCFVNAVGLTNPGARASPRSPTASARARRSISVGVDFRRVAQRSLSKSPACLNLSPMDSN